MNELNKFYENYIFSQQFKRKVSLGNFLLTKKGLIGISLVLIGIGLQSITPRGYIPTYISFAIALYLASLYIKTHLKTSSKLSIIDKDGWVDEENEAILIYSKLSWLLYKEIKRNKRKKN